MPQKHKTLHTQLLSLLLLLSGKQSSRASETPTSRAKKKMKKKIEFLRMQARNVRVKNVDMGVKAKRVLYIKYLLGKEREKKKKKKRNKEK